MAKLNSIDLIDWESVANKNWKQKKAIRKLIKKFGNSANLSREVAKRGEMEISPALISTWINKKLTTRDQNLTSRSYAKFLQKISKIKGLAADLCPKAKKENKL